jgi:hypothetical protein
MTRSKINADLFWTESSGWTVVVCVVAQMPASKATVTNIPFVLSSCAHNCIQNQCRKSGFSQYQGTDSLSVLADLGNWAGIVDEAAFTLIIGYGATARRNSLPSDRRIAERTMESGGNSQTSSAGS